MMWNPISWVKLWFLSMRQESLIFRPNATGIAPLKSPQYYGLRDTISLNIRSRDKALLKLWHQKPAHPPGEHHPEDILFLAFHGNTGHWGDVGPRGGQHDDNFDRRYRIRLLEAIIRAGAGFVAPTLRGYGGVSEQDARPGEEGFLMDVEAIVDYVLRKIEIRPRRIIVFGESLGAAAALMAASIMTARDRAPALVALVAPFSSLTDLVREKHYMLDGTAIRRRLRHPFDNVARIGQLRPETQLYIAHPDKDHLIGPEQSAKLAAEARIAGLKVTESTIEGGHVTWDTVAVVGEVLRLYRG